MTAAEAATDLGRAHVFLTGGTGFVGQAVLERLLSAHPQTTISLLVRTKGSVGGRGPRAHAAAQARVQGLAGSGRRRRRRGGRRRSGSASSRAGSGSVPALPKDLDVVIHSASTVSFDPPIDQAFDTNVGGAIGLYEALLASGGDPRVVHVSTCYVGGLRKGVAPEARLTHDVDWRAEYAAARSARDRVELLSREPERLRGFMDAAREVHGKEGPQAARPRERGRPHRVGDRAARRCRTRPRREPRLDRRLHAHQGVRRAGRRGAVGRQRPPPFRRAAGHHRERAAASVPGLDRRLQGRRPADPRLRPRPAARVPRPARQRARPHPGRPRRQRDPRRRRQPGPRRRTRSTSRSPRVPAIRCRSTRCSRTSTSTSPRTRCRSPARVTSGFPPGSSRADASSNANWPTRRSWPTATRSSCTGCLRRSATAGRSPRCRRSAPTSRRFATSPSSTAPTCRPRSSSTTPTRAPCTPPCRRRLQADRGFDITAIDWRDYLQKVHFPAITEMTRAFSKRPESAGERKPRPRPAAADGCRGRLRHGGHGRRLQHRAAVPLGALGGIPEGGLAGRGAQHPRAPAALPARRTPGPRRVHPYSSCVATRGCRSPASRRSSTAATATRCGGTRASRPSKRIREHRAAGHRTVLVSGSIAMPREADRRAVRRGRRRRDAREGRRAHRATSRVPPLVDEARAAWLTQYAAKHGARPRRFVRVRRQPRRPGVARPARSSARREPRQATRPGGAATPLGDRRLEARHRRLQACFDELATAAPPAPQHPTESSRAQGESWRSTSTATPPAPRA